MPNPWVSLRCDQLIPGNKVLSKKEQLENGLEEEEKKGFSNRDFWPMIRFSKTQSQVLEKFRHTNSPEVHICQSISSTFSTPLLQLIRATQFYIHFS
jgi:hypothetical protein